MNRSFIRSTVVRAGLLLGATVIRTRSLVVPLAWHFAINVPLYAYIACGTG